MAKTIVPPTGSPPRPALALRIGVTGHRPGSVDATGAQRIPPEAEGAIRETIGKSLDAIAAYLESVRLAHADVFAPAADGETNVVVISALAAGADQMVAEAGLSRGFVLDAVLPLPLEEYRRDQQAEGTEVEFDRLLENARARFVLDGTRAAADRAYEAAGIVMLACSDILVAVWDGQPGSGRGGTAQIVANALADNMPVVLISPGSPDDPTIVWTGFDALPAALARAEDLPHRGMDCLGDVITALVAPPDTGQALPRTDFARGLRRFARALLPFQRRRGHVQAVGGLVVPLGAYFAERERRRLGWLARIYPRLLALFTDRKLSRDDRIVAPYVEDVRRTWRGFAGGCGDAAPRLVEAIDERLLPAFAYADRLAVHYALLYRGAFVSTYLLAALAVTLALSGLLPWVAYNIELKVTLTVVEIIIIGGILWLYVQGDAAHWHSRFLEYRRLAEVLHPMRMLALVAAPDPIGRAHGGHHAGAGSFVPWYARAIRRALPLPDAVVDAGYLEAVRSAASDHRVDDATVSEIEEQIAYHRTNARRMGMMEEALHTWGERLFRFTFYLGVALALVFALVGAFGHHGLGTFHDEPYKTIKYAGTFLMALFPTLGAAMSAIRVQGDFGVASDRSRITAMELDRIRTSLLQHAPGLASVSDRLKKASDAMQVDLAQWHALSLTRPLSLPA